MLRVDLRAPSIPLERRVWRLFPGSTYKFLDEFSAQEVAFLDLPGLELLPEPLGNMPERELVARIVAAQQTAENIRAKRPDQPIVADWQTFTGARITSNRGKLRQALTNFFDTAARDDLVVVPSSLQIGKVHIGRFASDGTERLTGYFPKRYGAIPIPGRRVEWLCSVEENQVSSSLSRTLRHQLAFSLIERSLYNEIYSLTYRNFSLGEQYSSLVFNTEKDYTDKEAALLGLISRLAAIAVWEIDEPIEQAVEIASLHSLLRTVPADFSCSQTVDIHSPGFNRFISSRPTALVVGAVVSILIGLTYFATQGNIGEVRAQVEFVNSLADLNDPCTAQVSAGAARVLNSMSDDILWQACRSMQESVRRAGLGTDMIVRDIPVPQPRP